MKTWLITGASRGIGHALTKEVLQNGDRVIAFARDISPLEELKENHKEGLRVFSVDIANKEAVFNSIDACFTEYKEIDVVVNNAGQFLYGMLEEITEEQARYHMDVNFFGALWMLQATTPYLRKQGFGHVLQISSIGSMGGFASVGLYSAGKAALESISESFSMEVNDFGIKLTIFQLGGYATELFTRGATYAQEKTEYANLRTYLAELWGESKDADPTRAVSVIIEVTKLNNPPKHLILGNFAYDTVLENLNAKIKTYKEWETFSRKAE